MDAGVIALGVILIILGIAVAFDYSRISSAAFFCLTLFAFLFTGVSLIKPGVRKNIFLFLSIVSSFVFWLFLEPTSWNLDNFNNGLSLVALSLSIILLPSARLKAENEQSKLDSLNEEISRRDSRIFQIEKERDEHISRIEKERDSSISRIEKERDDHVSRIEDDHKKSINKLKQKAINDLLTANEQSRIEQSLLKEKIDNLEKSNQILREKNIQTDNSSVFSQPVIKSSIPERYSVVRDFSKISSMISNMELPRQIEFPKPIDIGSLKNFPKTGDFTKSILPGGSKSLNSTKKMND